jgi:hypothetical protein
MGRQSSVRNPGTSQFIEDLLSPHVIKDELDAAYKRMAEDHDRETAALVWAEMLPQVKHW